MVKMPQNASKFVPKCCQWIPSPFWETAFLTHFGPFLNPHMTLCGPSGKPPQAQNQASDAQNPPKQPWKCFTILQNGLQPLKIMIQASPNHPRTILEIFIFDPKMAPLDPLPRPSGPAPEAQNQASNAQNPPKQPWKCFTTL